VKKINKTEENKHMSVAEELVKIEGYSTGKE
jgi:hypothetical protein